MTIVQARGGFGLSLRRREEISELEGMARSACLESLGCCLLGARCGAFYS